MLGAEEEGVGRESGWIDGWQSAQGGKPSSFFFSFCTVPMLPQHLPFHYPCCSTLLLLLSPIPA